jgi:hypothetical protein
MAARAHVGLGVKSATNGACQPDCLAGRIGSWPTVRSSPSYDTTGRPVHGPCRTPSPLSPSTTLQTDLDRPYRHRFPRPWHRRFTQPPRLDGHEATLWTLSETLALSTTNACLDPRMSRPIYIQHPGHALAGLARRSTALSLLSFALNSTLVPSPMTRRLPRPPLAETAESLAWVVTSNEPPRVTCSHLANTLI